MKQYSKPATAIQMLALNTFVCGVTSVTPGEQPEGHGQLAPRKGDIID